MNRRTLCRSIVVALLFAFPARAIAAPTQANLFKTQATVFKKPKCKCCDVYAAYLRSYGFEVDVKITNELAQISSQAGIPKEFQGCHTMFVDGYVVEGLVPGHVVRKLLSERPAILGITLPGMPAGSPGMAGVKRDFIIYAVAKDGAPPGIYTVE
jgi:hypothetical protein